MNQTSVRRALSLAALALTVPIGAGALLEPSSAAGSATYRSADGAMLDHTGRVVPPPLRLEDVPPHVIAAIKLREDAGFDYNLGVSPVGKLRAMKNNILCFCLREGGSSLTEQLIKNRYTKGLPTILRKPVEPLLAVGMTLRQGKGAIMRGYLETAPFTAGSTGLAAGAARCWGKRIVDLTPNDAANLAVSLPAPANARCGRGAGRRKQGRALLDGLVEAGELTAAERRAARRSTPAKRTTRAPVPIRWCLDWVTAGGKRPDTPVTITCDTRLQAAAQNALTEELAALRKNTKGAVVAMRPDGAVLALIGGGGPTIGGGFNNAVAALRPANSVIKVFTLLALLRAGASLDDPVRDAPTDCAGYTPRNHDGRFMGTIRLRDAFRLSRNPPFVAEACKLKFFSWPRVLRDVGLRVPEPVVPSSLIGTGEQTLIGLTAAVAAIVRGRGPVVPHGVAGQAAAGMPTAEARTVCEAMTGVATSGTGRAAMVGPDTVAKTGSGDKDATIIAATGDLVIGVWVGVEGSRRIDTMGGGVPARVFRRIATAARGYGLVHQHRCGG